MRLDRKHSKTKLEKYLFSLLKELNKIQQEISKLPLLKLDKPEFAFYKIVWELNKDAEKSRYFKEYKYIVDNYSLSSKTTSIKKAKELNPPRFYVSKSEYNYIIKKFIDAPLWFNKTTEKHVARYYWIKNKFLEKKIYKMFYTHRKIINPLLEKRQNEICSIIYDNGKNEAILTKYRNGKVKFGKELPDLKKNILIKKMYQQEIKEELIDYVT